MIHKDKDDILQPSMLRANEGSTMHCVSILAALWHMMRMAQQVNLLHNEWLIETF